jgi:hypothetical protein
MSIDRKRIADLLLSRKKIGKKAHAQYLDDEDALFNSISCDGATILTLSWDGDFPGNSGALWVNKWKGMYFLCSSDFDPEGPYLSLKDVLDNERFSSSTSNPELRSETVPLRRLLVLVRGIMDEEGGEVLINGSRFELKSGAFVKLRAGSRHKR